MCTDVPPCLSDALCCIVPIPLSILLKPRAFLANALRKHRNGIHCQHGRAAKLYAYVDETGQDTQGTMFLVSVVVAGETRDAARRVLQDIE
jgi:hypothetical protein